MIASVHLADLNVRRALGVLRRAPDPASTPGLRYSKVALAAPLRSSLLPSPDIRRPALVAFWDDDDALSRFLAEDRAATPFAQGWQVRLEPLRAFGSWPGLPSDLPVTRTVDYDGPTVVLTLGRLRITQALRFLRTSAKAEAAVLAAPGLRSRRVHPPNRSHAQAHTRRAHSPRRHLGRRRARRLQPPGNARTPRVVACRDSPTARQRRATSAHRRRPRRGQSPR